MKDVYARAFSRTFVQTLQQFREAVERKDKHGANVCYATAMGLVSGAALSGGLNREKALELLENLAETRASFTAAFGDKPGASDIQIQ